MKAIEFTDEIANRLECIYMTSESTPPSADNDVVLYMQDYIVITPISAHEHDLQLLDRLTESLDRLPEWQPR